MKITIKINTSNDAFTGRSRAELAEILHNLAHTLEYSGVLNEDTKIPLLDHNGNTVGFLTIRE